MVTASVLSHVHQQLADYFLRQGWPERGLDHFSELVACTTDEVGSVFRCVALSQLCVSSARALNLRSAPAFRGVCVEHTALALALRFFCVGPALALRQFCASSALALCAPLCGCFWRPSLVTPDLNPL